MAGGAVVLSRNGAKPLTLRRSRAWRPGPAAEDEPRAAALGQG